MTAALSAGPLGCKVEWLFPARAIIREDVNATAEPSRDDDGHSADAAQDAAQDAALVTATLGGDDAAFGELVRRHKGRVFGMAARFARDAHEQEDVCQEIFVQAYRKLRDFRGESPFGHWLGRLAVRKCYDLLRRTRRERAANVSLDDALHQPADPGPPRQLRAREACEIVTRALETLPADDRLVITLLELEDIPVREIAALTGWSETNVRTRAYRARTALKKTLAQQGATSP